MLLSVRVSCGCSDTAWEYASTARPRFPAHMRAVVSALESLDQVSSVVWMDRAPPLNIFSLSKPLLPQGDASPERLNDARERSLANPLVVGQLLSPDGRTMLLMVRTVLLAVRTVLLVLLMVCTVLLAVRTVFLLLLVIRTVLLTFQTVLLVIQTVLLILLVLTMYSVASYPNGVVGIANSEYGVVGGPNGVLFCWQCVRCC